MANTLLTPSIIARQALASLYENMAMLPLVYTDLSREWGNQNAIGDTVNIRKPATFEARRFDRSAGIEIQNAAEGSVPVTLDTISDVSFAVTSEDLSLNIADFDEQLLSPAMEAIAQDVDRSILGLRSDVTQTVGVDEGFEWNKPETLIDAGRILDINKLPSNERYAVTGPTAKAHWMNSDIIKHADKSGSTEALRNGSIGRDIFGFEVFQTQNVGQADAAPEVGDPTTEVGLAFHRSAFAFVSAPMAVAPGSFGAVENYKGISLRVAYQYDINKKQTVVSVDTLFGVKTLDPKRAVLLKGADAA